ncbi:biopolymer transporter ExbD [Vibrio metschnikovii]|uniref:ExbD/TolR family protein n=1 Tax=Vibrio metschnikovii TaxID=28172 RepID=UPI002FC6042C
MIKTPPTTESSLMPDLTPLLDIIFIVMVFLLLTAAVKFTSLDVSLPSTDSSVVSEINTQSITVNILAQQPYWAIDGTIYVAWQDFTEALLKRSKTSEQPIVIAADKTAQVQNLVKLLAFLQENGIAATQLLTDENQ